MDESDEIKIDANLVCKVCGEQDFNLVDGFYFCNECGTKHDQVRAVIVEADDFDETGQNKNKTARKQKIRLPKTEGPQLTSWECYNYILRGIVEELLSMGAKEELKLMALQVWAAYLRRTETAFFNKKHVELPKLGVRFYKRDANILYNHCNERLKKRKRKHNDDSSFKSADSSQREWRKNKRKLDESQYSAQSRDSGTNCSGNSSSTGLSTKAVIQLKFSSLARKHYKKIMPIKHLDAHEKDSEGLLNCHKICPKKQMLHKFDAAATSLSIKQILSIIAIALNLVEDEIQLCDLVRFIDEERISKKYVYQYFPENIAPHTKELLKDISFHFNSNKYSYRILHEQTTLLSRFLHINEFKNPDIKKLTLRYIQDLNLPADVGLYVERLINLLPPKMKMRKTFHYPAYEARAMAYIVFVLKIIFGLDGRKEVLISNSARLVNAKINDINNAFNHCQKKLFVWSDWVEYIEMRKVIIAQYNPTFGRRFDLYQDPVKLLEELNDEFQREHDDKITKADNNEQTKQTVESMKRMFDQIYKNYSETQSEKVETLFFSPSLTPAHSYFKRILLHATSTDKSTVTLPEFMRVDHMQRSIKDYLQPKMLKSFFDNKNVDIRVQKVACTENRAFVGIFRAPDRGYVRDTALEADFDISVQDWLKEIKEEPQMEELEFKTVYVSYQTKSSQRYRNLLHEKNKHFEFKKPADKITNIVKNEENDHNLDEKCDILSLHSIDVFSEHDMQPINNFNISAPRRRFDGIDLWKNISSDECSESEHEIEDETMKTSRVRDEKPNKLKFLVSNLDYWILNGHLQNLSELQKKVLEYHFPRSFSWLLQTCAQTLGIEWSLLYKHLLVIEVMFVYGIESLEDFEECIKLKSHSEIKDINHIMQMLREIW